MAVIRPKDMPAVTAPAAGDKLMLDGATARSILATDFWLATSSFTQAGTGAVARTLKGKIGETFSVTDFGVLGTANDTSIFQVAVNALQAAGGGTLLVPAGLFQIASLNLPSGVILRGAGKNATYLQARQNTDVTVLTLSGTRGGVDNLSIYGKGVNNDTGVFGATQGTLVVTGLENVIADVLVWGGANSIYAPGVDNYFFRVNASFGFSNANVVTSGANWFVSCKFDHTSVSVTVTDTYPFANWAALTAYTAGQVRYVNGYALACTVSGTSGAAAPTLKNYTFNISDGTATWQLLAPGTYAGFYAATTAGENHIFQCDLSGPYSSSISLAANPGGVGPGAIIATDCVLSAGVTITTGVLMVLRGCELGIGNITIGSGYTGKTIIEGNSTIGSGTVNITVAANVNNFIIDNNFLGGGTITVAAGTSNRYRITNNPNCTVSDGGTGTDKVVATQFGALVASPIGGVGYAAGAGGAVTQATSKATGVALNTACGQITMNAAALAAATIVSFVLTDSAIAATDVLILNHISGGTPGSYSINARAAAGSATIDVRNNTAGSLAEAIVIQFALIKGVNL